ncbi:MAG: hypothetical protein GF308_19020 [Candidatus Heimdallarchaeota archaeon]|nr:hypothetical protein [Candidatus Heimdallarchaeota archaeon]
MGETTLLNKINDGIKKLSKVEREKRKLGKEKLEIDFSELNLFLLENDENIVKQYTISSAKEKITTDIRYLTQTEEKKVEELDYIFNNFWIFKKSIDNLDSLFETISELHNITVDLEDRLEAPFLDEELTENVSVGMEIFQSITHQIINNVTNNPFTTYLPAPVLIGVSNTVFKKLSEKLENFSFFSKRLLESFIEELAPQEKKIFLLSVVSWIHEKSQSYEIKFRCIKIFQQLISDLNNNNQTDEELFDKIGFLSANIANLNSLYDQVFNAILSHNAKLRISLEIPPECVNYFSLIYPFMHFDYDEEQSILSFSSMRFFEEEIKAKEIKEKEMIEEILAKFDNTNEIEISSIEEEYGYDIEEILSLIVEEKPESIILKFGNKLMQLDELPVFEKNEYLVTNLLSGDRERIILDNQDLAVEDALIEAHCSLLPMDCKCRITDRDGNDISNIPLKELTTDYICIQEI